MFRFVPQWRKCGIGASTLRAEHAGGAGDVILQLMHQYSLQTLPVVVLLIEPPAFWCGKVETRFVVVVQGIAARYVRLAKDRDP